MKSRYPASVQSIERGLTILEELSLETGGLGVTELARRTRLPASTVHRLLSVFVRRRYITRRGGRYAYRLEPRILGLGYLPVGLFCEVYQSACERFKDLKVKGNVEYLFFQIAGRSFTVRADRNSGGDGSLLFPELNRSRSNGCPNLSMKERTRDCRLLDKTGRGGLYRIERLGAKWCTCLTNGSENGWDRLGAGGSGRISRQDILIISSALVGSKGSIS